MMRVRAFLVPSIVLGAACATDRTGRIELADGSYELNCRKPLGDCLIDHADVCSAYGYDVVRANEEKSRNGVPPVDSEITTSHAVVRCRSGRALIAGTQASAPGPSASAAPSAVAAATRCFPGSTQACLGPGACKGAQTCSNDGSLFGPCDCGAPPAAAGVENDAGPPGTWATPTPDGG